MLGSCCAKPVTRIIKVADFEAGIIGLDQALLNVYVAGLTGDEAIQQELMRLIRDYGNYVSPSRENDYRQALLSEFRHYEAIHTRKSNQ